MAHELQKTYSEILKPELKKKMFCDSPALVFRVRIESPKHMAAFAIELYPTNPLGYSAAIVCVLTAFQTTMELINLGLHIDHQVQCLH
jgi:hypothetical protein